VAFTDIGEKKGVLRDLERECTPSDKKGGPIRTKKIVERDEEREISHTAKRAAGTYV